MKKLIIIGMILFGISSYTEEREVFPGDIERREIDGKVKVYVKGETEAFTGILTEFLFSGYPNSYHFVDGLLEGKEIDYYFDGRKAYERNMKNGLKDGLQIEYSYEGEKSEEIYNMGVLEVIIEYYPNNLKKSESIYNKDRKKDGMEIIYNSDGNVDKKILWKNGEIIKSS